MTHRIVLFAILVGLTLFQVAAAEQEADPPSIPFLGSWSKACDAWGTSAICFTNWRQGLGDAHLVQEYSIVRQSDQTLIFAGRGLYKIDGENVTGFWEDSQGAVHSIAGTYRDGTISVMWGKLGVEVGHSRYSYKSDKITVHDYILGEQGWREFMTVEYQRIGR